MEIVICAVIAYLFTGFMQAIVDLRSNVVDRPPWTWSPTLGTFIFASLIWPTRSLLAGYVSGGVAHAITLGMVPVVVQMVVMTAFIWGSYWVAGLVVDGLVLRLIVATLIAFLGMFLVFPFMSLVMMPVTTFLVAPVAVFLARMLDLLFSHGRR